VKWKHTKGDAISAPLSYTIDNHYVISHRSRQHTISYRPPGEHHHVSTWTTKAASIRAAEQHAIDLDVPGSDAATKLEIAREKKDAHVRTALTRKKTRTP
jgi:hypothetical protein